MTDIPEIRIEENVCIKCKACIYVCTTRVFGNINDAIEVKNPIDCWLCGHCIAICPVDAIYHSFYTFEDCPVVSKSLIPNENMVKTFFRTRRSIRVFSKQLVPRELLSEVMEYSRWAPSADNLQAVEWIAFDDPYQISELSSMAVDAFRKASQWLHDPLKFALHKFICNEKKFKKRYEDAKGFWTLVKRKAEGRDPIFFNAPIVLVAHVPKEDIFGRDNSIYEAYNIMLAAQLYGLGTCQIGYFIEALKLSPLLNTQIGLSADRQAEIALVLGYPKYKFWRLPNRQTPKLKWK